MTEEYLDDDIGQLLSALEAKTPDYPADLLAKRRASYQQGMAGLGTGLVATGAATGGLLAGVWSIDGLLMALIAVVLVAEAVGGAILYRQRRMENITSLLTPSLTAAPPTTAPSPTRTATPSPTGTATATATLRPFFTFGPGLGPVDPRPPGPSPTKRGNHYGQTPKPPDGGPRSPRSSPSSP